MVGSAAAAGPPLAQKPGVGRRFRNANQVTVLGRPISLVVIAER